MADLYFEFLPRAHETIMRLVGGVAVPSDRLSMIAMAYVGSILEFEQALTDLLKAQHTSSAQVVLRSTLEAYVDFLAVLADPTYSNSRDLTSYMGSLDILEAAKAGGNPFLAGIAAEPDLDKRIVQRKAEIAALKNGGAQNHKVRKRFELAGVPELYNSVYSMLCLASHNDSGELARRHFVREKDGLSLVMFRHVEFTDYILLLDTACAILIGAARDLQKLPNIRGDLDVVATLYNELEAIRKRVDETPRAH